MREFNTSGPNIPERHYTLFRQKLLSEGEKLVKNERYFTIWAPRQTGKSTFFLQLTEKLKKKDYKVCWINFEDFKQTPLKTFLNDFVNELSAQWAVEKIAASNISEVFSYIKSRNQDKCVLIIDKFIFLSLLSSLGLTPNNGSISVFLHQNNFCVILFH